MLAPFHSSQPTNQYQRQQRRRRQQPSSVASTAVVPGERHVAPHRGRRNHGGYPSRSERGALGASHSRSQRRSRERSGFGPRSCAHMSQDPVLQSREHHVTRAQRHMAEAHSHMARMTDSMFDGLGVGMGLDMGLGSSGGADTAQEWKRMQELAASVPRGSSYRRTHIVHSSHAPSGRNRTEEYEETSLAQRNQGVAVRETLQRYNDSETGNRRMALERSIGNQARKIVHSHFADGGEERADMLRGLGESDTERFDMEWELLTGRHASLIDRVHGGRSHRSGQRSVMGWR